MPQLRVIYDPPGAGAWNMALDEALLEASEQTGQATLRFYSWSEPTLSLGYFQNAADRELHPPSRACPLVRRASGGGAILHHHELTYSIVWPLAGSLTRSAELYDLVHRTLIATLASCGVSAGLHQDTLTCAAAPVPPGPDPFLCFQRRTCADIVSRGIKIVGSAQRRRKSAILQHGSILLAKSPYAPELPGILEVAHRNIEVPKFAAAWTASLAAALGVTSREGGLTKLERDQAQEYVKSRFTSPAYVHRR